MKLRDAMEAAYTGHGITRQDRKPSVTGYPEFGGLEQEIRDIPGHESLLARLSPIFSLGLFRSQPNEQNFLEFINEPTVIRLAPLPTEEVKLAVSEFILLRLYNLLVTGKHQIRPNRLVAIDEAHKLNNSDAVIKLFREIRKFGVAMILSSQKARDFHQDIHSNAASCLFLKNSEISDRKYIAEQIAGTGKQKEEIVSLLLAQNTFEGLFRNDHYRPFERVKVTPYFQRIR